MRKAKHRPGKLKLKKRKDSPYWYLTGTINGRRYNQSTGCTDRILAEEYRIKCEFTEQTARIHGEEVVITFAQAVTEYAQSGKDTRFLMPLLDYFGVTQIIKITPRDVRAAALNLYPGRANSTINRQVISPVSAVINYALEGSGLSKRRFPKLPEPKGRLRWLTPEEAERLIEAARGRNHTGHMILTLLGTGLRLGEMQAMDREDLHLNSWQAFIPFEKSGSGRMVSYPRRTAAALSTLDSTGRIFRTQHGRPFKVRSHNHGAHWNAFDAAAARAGLKDVTPHTLRHTWATWHYAQTKDLIAVQELGGWAKLDMLRRYTKLAPADLPARLSAFGWDFTEIYTKNEPVQNRKAIRR